MRKSKQRPESLGSRGRGQFQREASGSVMGHRSRPIYMRSPVLGPPLLPAGFLSSHSLAWSPSSQIGCQENLAPIGF